MPAALVMAAGDTEVATPLGPMAPAGTAGVPMAMSMPAALVMAAPAPATAVALAGPMAATMPGTACSAPAFGPLQPCVPPLCPVAAPVAPAPVQPLGDAPARTPRGPPLGSLHRFHVETAETGMLSADGRKFTKEHFQGRLSVLTEDKVHSHGILKYALRFTGGELSSADGVGFIFSNKLPCPKNIQRIVSIFANRTGRICVRAHAEVVRSDIGVKPLDIGDWVAVTVDLERQEADFAVWPADGGPSSSASINFGVALKSLKKRIPALVPLACGYFACVVKHHGVSVELGS
mmetsp:Transcript_87005/g.241290  ORF Transcript_87005/g.241290 Transcript_87005/m.241290 type:complete len:291 (-) Transcript_87005:304-1176(-)